MQKINKFFSFLLLGIIVSGIFLSINTQDVSASCGRMSPSWDFYHVDAIYRGVLGDKEKTGEIVNIAGDGSEFINEMFKFEFVITDRIKGDHEIGDEVILQEKGYPGAFSIYTSSFYGEKGDDALVFLSRIDENTYVGASYVQKIGCVADIVVDSEYKDLDEIIEENITNPFQGSINSKFYSFIKNNYLDGVDNGYHTHIDNSSTKVYKPDQLIIRSELVTMLARAFDIPLEVKEDTKFTDVQQNRIVVDDGNVLFLDYDAAYILAFKDLGLISGYSDGSFRPNDEITRGEASKILINVMKYKGLIDENAEYDHVFPDVTEDNKFKDYIAILNTLEVGGEKIVSGYSDGEFKTENNITRGEAAKVVDLARKY